MQCPNCEGSVISKEQDYVAKNSTFQEKRLFKCSSCELVFASPMPASNELCKYYNTYWDGDVATVSVSTEQYYLAQSIARIRYIKEHINFKENLCVLDVGAGAGTIADALKKEGVQCEYNAVEPDNVQRNNLATKPNISDIYSDIDEIPSKNKFDLIILSHVLEHVPNPHQLIQTSINSLGINGYLFIEVPNEDYKYKHVVEPHLLFFNQLSLLRCIQDHGEVINIISVGKQISDIEESPSQSLKNPWMTFTKELAKGFLAKLDKNHINKQIIKYQMCDYGNDRQWLRAIIRRP